MLCGQAFPKNGVLEIAAADTGQGMWASLKRFPSMLETLQGDANGILTALTLKVRAADGAVRPRLLEHPCWPPPARPAGRWCACPAKPR